MRRVVSTICCWVLLALASSSASFAMDPERKAVAQELDSPDAATTTGNFTPKAIIEASTDKTTATLSYAKAFALDHKSWLLDTALTVKAPFDSSKDDVKDIGSISGLTAGTNVRLEIGTLYWPLPSPASLQEIDRVCNQYLQRVLPDYHWSTDPNDLNTEDLGASEHNLAKITKGASCFVLLAPGGLDDALKKINDKVTENAKLLNKPPPSAIAPVAGSEDVLAAGFEALKKANKGTLARAHSVTLALTANRQKFSFASEATPTEVTDANKTGKGISLSYSYIMPSSVLAIGVSYQKSFKGADEVQICSPIGSTGSTQCSSAALKGPTESTDKLIFAEYRAAIGSNVALSPRVEYKTTKSDVGVSLPIYLAKNEQHVLDGGVSLGWTREDHFAASVFVSKAFQFFD